VETCCAAATVGRGEHGLVAVAAADGERSSANGGSAPRVAAPTAELRPHGPVFLDKNAAFRRSDFIVEVAQEVHSEQPIDIIVTEVEYVDRKTRQREPSTVNSDARRTYPSSAPIAVWTFVRRNPSRGL